MDTTPQHPTAGDAVRILQSDDVLIPAGSVGIIDGRVGARYDEPRVCFGCYSAFRGMSNGPSSADRAVYVSCSGGPLPYVAADQLKPTGQTYRRTFWRWKDWPRAGGGESYELDVPLWEWGGPPTP